MCIRDRFQPFLLLSLVGVKSCGFRRNTLPVSYTHLDNLLVMQSDELADIIEIMEKFYNDIRWLDTELFELWNERICFLVIIRVITCLLYTSRCV